MALKNEEKREIIGKFAISPRDTGSVRVQVALLTRRIQDLNGHFSLHKKDHSSRRGLLKLVGSRRSLLKYFKEVDLVGYRSLIEELGLRK